uniref:ATP synthase complex subunit 8 n=1 Tax=Microphis brachyurus TaxID=161466 RepID=A0A0N7AQC0_MICBA|nr:ATP synthase F0 subunit 8 [Oostethus brachyurus]
MPQLNPSPWFAILIFSWTVLATIVPMKIMAHKSPNNPSALESDTPQNKFWSWPWH